MNFDSRYIWDALPLLMRLTLTLIISLSGLLGGLIIGLRPGPARIRWDNIQNGIAGVCGINPRDANYGAGDVYLLRPADGVAGAY
jgi:hypothetical protein